MYRKSQFNVSWTAASERGGNEVTFSKISIVCVRLLTSLGANLLEKISKLCSATKIWGRMIAQQYNSFYFRRKSKQAVSFSFSLWTLINDGKLTDILYERYVNCFRYHKSASHRALPNTHHVHVNQLISCWCDRWKHSTTYLFWDLKTKICSPVIDFIMSNVSDNTIGMSFKREIRN